MRCSALVALCLVAPLVVACTTASFIKDQDAVVDALHPYLHQHGGFFEGVVGRLCETCPRGVFAVKDYKAEDVIANIPLPSGINLGPYDEDCVTPVLERLLLDTEWNKAYAPYWASLPRPDDLQCLQTFTVQQMDLLQAPRLAAVIKDSQAQSAATFYGEGGTLNHIRNVSNGTVTPIFAYFNYLSAIFTTRAFHFSDPETQADTTYLLPSIDLINHSVERANVQRHQEGWQIQLLATRDIKAGEELLFEYDGSVMHRPDMSLVIYGFVADDQEPILAAVDRADFTEDNPYASTPTQDDISEVEDVAAEAARVEALLQQVEAASTLEADQELLAALLAGERPLGTDGWTWKEVEIIKFRVTRKTALRRWLLRLQEHLEAGGAQPHHQPPAMEGGSSAEQAEAEA